MKQIGRLFSSLRGWVRIVASLLLLATATFFALGRPPLWWASRGVTKGKEADDFAPVNQGQVKNLAAAAIAEFNARLDGGAGEPLNQLLASWAHPTSRTDDYAAVNVGQLKALAKPFYDRLIAKGYATAYPWEGTDLPVDDFALANNGQAKNLFAFRLALLDTKGLIPDWWILVNGLGGGSVPFDSSAEAPGGVTYAQKYDLILDPLVGDTDGDGFTDGAELIAGTNPKNAASQPAPLAVNVEMTWASAYATKVGFSEYTEVSSPPKIYLKRSRQLSGTTKVLGSVIWAGAVSESEEYSPATKSWAFSGTSSGVTKGYATDGHLTSKNTDSTLYGASWQKWGKSNLTDSDILQSVSNQRNTWEEMDQNNDPVWKSSTYDETGDYSMLIKFQGGPMGAHWNGTNFDLASGTTVWEGLSHYTENAAGPVPPDFAKRATSSFTLADGWLGSETVNGGQPVPIDGPAFHADWNYNGDFEGGIPAQARTKLTWDSHGERAGKTRACTGTEELTEEYTTAALKANALADMPDYRSEWELTVPFTEVPVGTYGFAADETFFAMTKATYRLTANASAPQHIIWYEYFNPYDGTKPGKICAIRHWNKTETIACESPETYEISPTGADGEGYYTIKLVGVEITEVVSDQIADNEANKLPSASYGQQPNNPMLMATRTGKEAYLAVRLAMNAEIASAIWVGARKVGDPQIRGKVPAVPGTTRLHFMADDGSNLYEIVAGRGDEVVAVFQKTPKIDPNGMPYSGKDQTYELIDRVLIVTNNDYITARKTAEGYGLGVIAEVVPNAAALVGAFATGSSQIAGCTTQYNQPIRANTLSHPVGGRWDNIKNEAQTHRIQFSNTSSLAQKFVKSKSAISLYGRLIQSQNRNLLTRATDTLSVITLSDLSDDKILLEDSDSRDLHYSIGKCSFSGTLEVECKRNGTTIAINSLNCYGYLDDTYDWAHGGGKFSKGYFWEFDAKYPARTQAGHATLTANPWPTAGQAFFTRINFGTGKFRYP